MGDPKNLKTYKGKGFLEKVVSKMGVGALRVGGEAIRSKKTELEAVAKALENPKKKGY